MCCQQLYLHFVSILILLMFEVQHIEELLLKMYSTEYLCH